MKTVTLAMTLFLTITYGAISEDTVLPEDAALISDLVLEIAGFEPLVNIAVDDSCLVVFVVTGQDWADNDEGWDELATLLAIVSGVDYERYWQARDVVVGYFDIWFNITMEDLFWLSENVETLTENEWWQEFKNRTETYPKTMYDTEEKST